MEAFSQQFCGLSSSTTEINGFYLRFPAFATTLRNAFVSFESFFRGFKNLNPNCFVGRDFNRPRLVTEAADSLAVSYICLYEGCAYSWDFPKYWSKGAIALILGKKASICASHRQLF